MSVLHITKDTFEKEVMASTVPVLVDFWATWCAPCRRQAGAIDELAAEGYQVGKIDVDQEPDLAGTFEVMSIPTLIVFEGGKEVKRFVGLQSKAVLEAALKE